MANESVVDGDALWFTCPHTLVGNHSAQSWRLKLRGMDCNSVNDFLEAVSKGQRHVQLWEVPELTDDEVEAIATATQTHANTFSQLGFFRCRLTEKQIRMLCEGISNQVDHLLFQYVGVRDTGIQHIVRLLRRKDMHLQRLFVCDDNLGDSSITMLSDAIRQNQHLRLLCVTDNPITMTGVEALHDALKYNTSLRTIHLTVSNIPDLKLERVLELNGICRQTEIRSHWQRIVALCMVAYGKYRKPASSLSLPLDVCRIVKNMLCSNGEGISDQT